MGNLEPQNFGERQKMNAPTLLQMTFSHVIQSLESLVTSNDLIRVHMKQTYSLLH